MVARTAFREGWNARGPGIPASSAGVLFEYDGFCFLHAGMLTSPVRDIKPDSLAMCLKCKSWLWDTKK